MLIGLSTITRLRNLCVIWHATLTVIGWHINKFWVNCGAFSAIVKYLLDQKSFLKESRLDSSLLNHKPLNKLSFKRIKRLPSKIVIARRYSKPFLLIYPKISAFTVLRYLCNLSFLCFDILETWSRLVKYVYLGNKELHQIVYTTHTLSTNIFEYLETPTWT